MTIERHSFAVDLDPPLRTSDGRLEERTGWIVEAGSTAIGFGEAAPLPGFTESLDASDAALDVAIDALDDGSLPDAFAAVTGAPAARHAVATALLDSRAREDRNPLYRELGGRETVDAIPVNATVGDGSPGETLAAVEAAVNQGFETVKVKVGARPLDTDLHRIDGLIDALDPTIDLRVDVNGAWDRETARTAIEHLPADRISLIEQPLAADDLAGHRQLRGSIPIGLDESLAVHSPTEVVRRDAADLVVLKPMALGGPDVARALARDAHRHGVETVVSNTIETAVGRTTALHVAASLDRRSPAGLATADRLAEDVATDPAPVSNGHMPVPASPGIGISGVRMDA